MKNIINIINKHFDFKFNILALVSLLILLLSLPPIAGLFPERFGWENGFFENIQMIVLFVACFLALKTKNIENKKFFVFAFLILTILMLREVNCGRTLFFPIEGTHNAFYSWKEIPYGYLAHPIFGLYIAFAGVYFIFNKLWKNLFDLLMNYKLPVFNVLFMIAGMVGGLYAEKAMSNNLLEEIFELAFYFSLCSIIYFYSFNKQKNIK